MTDTFKANNPPVLSSAETNLQTAGCQWNPTFAAGFFSCVEPLQMLGKKEVLKLFNTRDYTLKMWQDLGMLKGIKTGRSWVFSRQELFEFQQKYSGYDISNRPSAMKAHEEVMNRKNRTE